MEELQHYGVKGMTWGKTKKRDYSGVSLGNVSPLETLDWLKANPDWYKTPFYDWVVNQDWGNIRLSVPNKPSSQEGVHFHVHLKRRSLRKPRILCSP